MQHASTNAPPAAYDRPPPDDAPGSSADAALTDVDVVAAFHLLLKDALAQARAEGLIDDDLLERADVDVQVNGPALSLCFAALQAEGSPPAIRAPDASFVLDNANCPPSFRAFFEAWQLEVIPIQRLSLESRHDLIRLICDKPPLNPAIAEQQPDIPRITATLKSIAINLVQRRTFQLLFSDDLQHALDNNVRPRSPCAHSSRTSGESTRSNDAGRSHQYQPPPGYEPAPAAAAGTPAGAAPPVPPPASAQSSNAPPLPEKSNRPLPPTPAVPAPAQRPDVPPPPSHPSTRANLTPSTAASRPPAPGSSTHPPSSTSGHGRTPGGSETLRVPGLSPPTASSSLPTDDPNLTLIRETLLSALADVLATTPSIRALLSRGSEWASHAYFACLCLAILDVALHRVTPSGGVRCVQMGKGPGKIIGMGDCPLQLRRLLWALSNIGAKCQRLAEDDDLAAVKLVEMQDQQETADSGTSGPPDGQHTSSSSSSLQTNRIERLRYRLENGTDRDASSSSSSPSSAASPPSRDPGAGNVRLQTSVTEVSNNINQLALAFFKIPTFRERQRDAFKVLQAVETL